MKKFPPTPSLPTLLILQILISLSFSDLPVDFYVKPPSCNSNADCTYNRFSKCNGSNQCVQCEVAADCAQFSVAGETVTCAPAIASPAYNYCVIPCSGLNKEPCRKMRGHCVSNTCRQCSSNTHCRGEGYPGSMLDLWCDDVSVPGFKICNSCPEDGCPGTSTCQNFKCVECTSDANCGAAKPFCEKKFEGNVCRACYEDSQCTTPALSRCNGNSCAKCTNPGHCAHIPGKPYCHSTLGCVECNAPSHCTSGRCVGNVCVECEQDTHCLNALNPKCISNFCGPCSNPTTVCSDNFSGKPICSSTGACVACDNHPDCLNPSQPECSSSTKTCQPCSSSAVCTFNIDGNQCATTGPNTGKCVKCISDGTCSGSLGKCEVTTTNTCVECINHSDCIDPQKPQCLGNTCQACPDSAFCLSLPGSLDKCATSGPNIGACVQCIIAGDCSGTAVCSTTFNTCTECTDHIHCLDPTKPRCSSNTCQPCSDSTFCSGLDSNFPQCAVSGPNLGKCVKCNDPIHCSSGSLNHCSNTLNTCVECTDHTHCLDPSKPQCLGNTCQACPDSSFCLSLPGFLDECATTGPNIGACVQCNTAGDCPGAAVCSNILNTCVECADHPDCSDPTKPRCSSNTCQPCSDSTFCSNLDINFPQCALSGPNLGKCVQCTDTLQCSSGSLNHCSDTLNTCVECKANNHCLDPTKPRCSGNTCQPCSNSVFCSSIPGSPEKCALTGPNTGACVECTDRNQCSGSMHECSSVSNTCVQCTDHTHCTDPSAPFCSANTCQGCPDPAFCNTKYPGDLPYCLAGTCVQCTDPSHCPGSSCSSSNTCIGCTGSGDCPTHQLPLCLSSICQPCTTASGVCAARFSTTKPICLSGECVECETSTHCTSSPKLRCETVSHTCVECTGHGHCIDPLKPRCVGNTCQACSGSAPCAGVLRCVTSGPKTGACVACTENTHCPATTPVCDLTSNTCVDCSDHSDCTDSSAPFCSANTCQGCPDPAFCNTKYPGDLPYCVAGACVKCIAVADCLAPTPSCSSVNTCVECTGDSQCLSTSLAKCWNNICQSCTGFPNICSSRFLDKRVCSSGECVQCEISTHCTYSSSKPQCHSASKTCVECLDPSHCQDPKKPFCGASNTCEPCPGSTFCSNLPSAPNQCAVTGPNTGACVECTGGTHCASGANKVCSLTSNTCVACSDHPHCLDPSAPLCSANTCQGCSGHSFCNTKYPGDLPYCESGACVECTTSGHCLAPTPYCSSAKTCVECTQDSECPSFSLAKCSSNSCQPCTGFANICSSRFSDKPICYLGECVECTDESHCLDSTKPFCGTSNTCQSCSSASITFCPTQHPGVLPFCLTTTGACVECLQSTDCPDPSLPNCISNTCQSTIYQPYCSPSYNIQIKQSLSRLNHFDLHFPSDLVSKIDIESTLTLTLLNIPQSDYTYTLKKMTNTHYQAIFTIQITIPPTKIRLKLPCPPQPGFIFGDIILEAPIQSIPLIDPDLEETMDTIETITTVTANVMAGASGSMILAGANPALMWALIELLQAFYYMIFINVQYPVNVKAFFGLFSLGNLPFIPNPIEWFFPEIDSVDLQAPSKFLENDVDGLFLQTAGNMLLTWFLVLVGFLASKFILKFTRNMPRLLNRAAFKMVKMFEWSGVIRTFMTSYTQLSLAAFLQIRVLNFDRQLYGVSSISGMAFTIFALVFPPVLTLLIHKFSKYPKILNTTFSTLTDEFKYDKQKLVPIYFNAFFVIRRLVLVLALVFLHDYPYLEVIFLILSCVIWLILLLKYSPYDKKMHNIVNIISEFLLVVIHIIILLFAHDDHKDWLTDQKKLDLGWIIISCCGVILIMTLIVACIEQYYVTKDLIQLLRKFLRERKSSSRGIKRKGSPQIRSTQESILNSQNTSTDDLNNSIMPFIPLQNIAQRRRIVRPPRMTTGTSKTPSPMMTQKDNQSFMAQQENRRQFIRNHIRDILMKGKKKDSRTQKKL